MHILATISFVDYSLPHQTNTIYTVLQPYIEAGHVETNDIDFWVEVNKLGRNNNYLNICQYIQ